MTSPFNANEYIERLEAAGVPGNQAVVHACALSDALGGMASASDLRQVELSARIDKLDTTLNAKIDKLEIKLDARGDKLDARIDSVRAELVVHRWALDIIAAFTMSNTAMLWRLFERLG